MRVEEAAARLRVEDLESRIAELTGRLEVEREAWSRLRVTRETVAEVLAEISEAGAPAGRRRRRRLQRGHRNRCGR
ncbi:hypothetical protein [Streptomyces sp. NPDC002746]